MKSSFNKIRFWNNICGRNKKVSFVFRIIINLKSIIIKINIVTKEEMLSIPLTYGDNKSDITKVTHVKIYCPANQEIDIFIYMLFTICSLESKRKIIAVGTRLSNMIKSIYY